MRARHFAAAIALTLTLAGCAGEAEIPSVEVTVGNQSASIEPTVYCIAGEPQIGADDAGTEALQVGQSEQITVEVTDDVAEKSWTIQVWSVGDSGGKAVPGAQLGTVPVSENASSAQFSTADVAPQINRFFIIVALPEDPDCTAPASAGIWTLMLSRV